MIHFDLLRDAICLSLTQNKTGPFGAVIVDNHNKVIATGQNKVTITNDPTAHAEIVAIRQACKTINDFDLTDYILYTSCEPCPMCLSACYWAHIKEIWYACTAKDAAEAGFDDEIIYKEFKIDSQQRQLPMFHVHSLRDEGVEAFKKWKKNPNRIEY